MGNWKWVGIDRSGKKVVGELQGKDERDIRRILRGKGIRPKKLTPPSILEFDIGEFLVERGLVKSFGNVELSSFTKQLAIMVNAGVPIIQSLEILYKNEKNPALKRAVRIISQDVGEGKTIADAMRKHDGFGELYCNLVKAGEAGGILDSILKKLTEHMDKQEKIRAQIKGAMTYPTVVVGIGCLVIWGMMVFVVPKFMEMLTDSGQQVPLITQLVVGTSKFFGEYSVVILVSLVGGFLALKSYIKSPSGKVVFDNAVMKTPLFGLIVIKGNLASFSRTLATMLGAGVALIDSLSVCIDTVDNIVISSDLKIVRKAVVEGKTLTEPLSKIEYFPSMVAQMIKVGEQTGNLPDMLDKIADVFEEQVNGLISNMTKMIEPLVIVVLGGIIATIMVAMYLPVFMAAGGAD